MNRRIARKKFKNPKVPRLLITAKDKRGAKPTQLMLPFPRKDEPEYGTLEHLLHCKAEFEKARTAKNLAEMRFWSQRFNTSVLEFLKYQDPGFGTKAYEDYCERIAASYAPSGDRDSVEAWKERAMLSQTYRKNFLEKKRKV